MSTPFKMKAGSSPMKHFFGKHPSKKDGHKKSDHKKKKKSKKTDVFDGMQEAFQAGATSIVSEKATAKILRTKKNR